MESLCLRMLIETSRVLSNNTTVDIVRYANNGLFSPKVPVNNL